MPIKNEVIEEATKEMRDNLVRVLNRVHELEGLEDFADSIQEVMPESIDTITIDLQEIAFTLKINVSRVG
jgi:hypothetical protein